jgi:hypothetical protein
MSRRLSLVFAVLAALAAVPVALAAYPSPFAAQGGEGVLSKDGSLRFVAVGNGADTVVKAIRRADGSTVMSQALTGSYGVPMLTQNGPGGGLFRDGSTFVLQSTGYKPVTTFQLMGARDLGARDTIRLKGTFAFDALSPDSSKLYLIQHTSVDDITHYVVRAYDLGEHTLMAGKIADKSQKGWVMQGFPTARASTGDGRWVYTLYSNPGGYPFVHALDTVRGVAHCVGIQWNSVDQGPLFGFRLAVEGKKLMVKTGSGGVYRVIDRRTWRVTKH